MKLTKYFTRLMSVLFLTSILSISCQKENSNSSNLSTSQEATVVSNSSEADAEAELIFDGIFDDVMGVNDEVGMAGIGIFGQKSEFGSGETARTDSLFPNPMNHCFTVTKTLLNAPDKFPLRIVMDFGLTGCKGRDGHLRKGKIITTYTNRLIFPQASTTTTFENFSIDSIKIEGVHKITNTSTSNVRSYSVRVEGSKITKPNGNYTEWNSTKLITQIEGLGTPFVPIDDIFKIEGYANGKVKTAAYIVSYRSEIIEPLIKKFSCRWIVKGRIKTWRSTTTTGTTPNDAIIAVLDYGDGSCDNKATLTVNSVTREITLH